MKKRKLKKWVRTTIEIAIVYLIGVAMLLMIAARVNQLNKNIDKCGQYNCIEKGE